MGQTKFTMVPKNDQHQRPVSIHFSHPWRATKIWKNDGLGFSYSNAYTGFQSNMGELGRPQSGLGGALLTYIGRHFRPHRLQRPTLIGEWGGLAGTKITKRSAAEWRTGLWMQAVLPYSGNTGFWWWLWVDASDGWKQMTPVRKFITDEDPRGRELKPIITRVRHPERRFNACVWSPHKAQSISWATPTTNGMTLRSTSQNQSQRQKKNPTTKMKQ